MGYTNHTHLLETLEKWPVRMFETVLPRHLRIIYEINRRFLQVVETRRPSDQESLKRMSIIEEGRVKQVRMAHLAIVGSHSVNGAAALHSELVKSQLVPEFHQLWPEQRGYPKALVVESQSAAGQAALQDRRRRLDH